MDFEHRKQVLMEWFESLEDERVIEQLEQLRNEDQSIATHSFVPMTKEELIARAKSARKDIEEGRLFTTEEIKKESENW